MQKKVLFPLLWILLFSFFNKLFAQDRPISELRCDYLVEPIGLDNQHPIFSWISVGIKEQKSLNLFVSNSKDFAKNSELSYSSGNLRNKNNHVTYQGPSLQPFQKYYWKIRVTDANGKSYESPVASFEMGMVTPDNWVGAWITDIHDINEGRTGDFRKQITISKKVKHAVAYIACGGLFESYLNGKKIGENRLEPLFTRYDRRVEYVAYDITSLLEQGENVLGISLGNGWYNHQPVAVWFFDKAPWRARPKFCMDIRITYADGTSETLGSDNTWKTHLSELTRSNLYTGEWQDHQLIQNGWLLSNFVDSAWHNASYVSPPSKNIVAMATVPIKDVNTLYPVSVKQLNDTSYVFDMGRNIAGVSELHVKGNRGDTFKLVHGERLNSDGTVDMSNIDYFNRPANRFDLFGTDVYTLAGGEWETFRPHFNYKGFQYVQITVPQETKLDKQNLKAYFMHSDVRQLGHITTSNELINKIWAATNASYLSNLFGYPTDCPQREKNGWTGDAHIAVETGLYNFDGITVYKKWLSDNIDMQQPNGILPAIVPTDWWGLDWGNGPDWTSTLSIIPWNLYLFYGDSGVLRQSYGPLKKYLQHLESVSPNNLTDWGLGDWIPIKSIANKELVISIYYFVNCRILSQMAEVLGHTKDKLYYQNLSEKVKKAINDKYYHSNIYSYAEGLQTELSMPLFWGIVPENQKEKVAKTLYDKVQKDGQMDVGLLGSKAILNALSENGCADMAYELASRETFPSWGYWIKNGATTLYENWKITGTRDLSMNHIMFGEIGAWFYKGLGGIFPDHQSPGFKHFILKPNIVKGLEHFEASFNSPYGKIVSKWWHDDKHVKVDIEVPSNSSASLYLNKEDKTDVVEIGPGTYHYEWNFL